MPYSNPERQRQAKREHYKANRDKYRRSSQESGQRRREAVRAIVRKAKDKPCADCGTRYPYYVMQFDHLDSAAKQFDISRATSMGIRRSADLEREIAKCDVVCANCHAERTYRRGFDYEDSPTTSRWVNPAGPI